MIHESDLSELQKLADSLDDPAVLRAAAASAPWLDQWPPRLAEMGR